MSLTYAKVVDGSRANARVAVIEENGTIEGFLAYELSAGNVAIPIGYPMNDLQGFVSSSPIVDVRAVVRGASLRGWRFHHAPAEQHLLAPFYYRPAMERSPLIDLSGGYQLYASSRSKAVTRRWREQRRSIERQVGTLSLRWGSSRPGGLRQLLDWQCSRYKAAGRMFADDPTALPIVESIAASDSDDCRGLLIVLAAGERPIASHLYLSGPRGLTGAFTSYGQSLSKFSPGTMIYFAVCEAAATPASPGSTSATASSTIKCGWPRVPISSRLARSGPGVSKPTRAGSSAGSM
jgi:CelD/BcsL family acetyltransferase involved in cellulose biosynthesis